MEDSKKSLQIRDLERDETSYEDPCTTFTAEFVHLTGKEIFRLPGSWCFSIYLHFTVRYFYQTLHVIDIISLIQSNFKYFSYVL